jgi:hypothetical protein
VRRYLAIAIVVLVAVVLLVTLRWTCGTSVDRRGGGSSTSCGFTFEP